LGINRQGASAAKRILMKFQALMVAILMAAPLRLNALDDPSGAPSEGKAGTEILVMLYLPPQHFRPDANYGGTYQQVGSEARQRVAADIARSHGLIVNRGWPMPTIGVDCYVMHSQSDQPIGRVLESVMHDPRVKWAQPLTTFRAPRDSGPH
jgi:hypothetical protein